MADPAYRQQVIDDFRADADSARIRAHAWAEAHNEPTRWVTNDTVTVLIDYHEETGPVYRSTLNRNAAISTATDQLIAAPFGLNGAGITAGIWDGGNVRSTHQEFASGRVVNMQSFSLDNHATHVAGTMIARGASASARGMATNATLIAYEFNNDLAEMTQWAMAAPGEEDTIQISNHSYGFLSGWSSGFEPIRWYGTWGGGVQESDNFGRYSATDRDRDGLIYAAPYFLPFISAGNDRNDVAPPVSTNFQYFSAGQWRTRAYDPNTDPFDDGWKQGGYNTIPFGNTLKNAVVVGAVNDAVTSGQRDLTQATMSAFSSWGPTDDGRIKPDIVANGVALTSPIAGSDTQYGISSGTSMSAPNASGSAILLLEHFSNLFPGEYMLASTIKGLILHTADSLDDPGPDYRNGWGLMNARAAADHITAHAEAPMAGHMIEDVITNGSTVSYEVLWNGSDNLWATLVWTDPPGPARTGLNNTNLVLVNDLDLRIISPAGVTNFPWVLDPANPTNAATVGDNFRDNVEQVYLNNPAESGIYTIRITHKGTLTDDEQVFSLMVSGVIELDALRLEGDLDYGSVQIDSTKERILTLHNDNPLTITVTNMTLPAGFSTDWQGTVPASESRDLVITFQPTATTAYGAELTIFVAESDTPILYPITGNGVDELFLTITEPLNGATVSFSNDTAGISGTAGSALTGFFTWSNDEASAGGTIAAQSTWSIPTVPLVLGTNTINVSATNFPSNAVIASDSASGSSWTTGDNSGTGFHAWILSATDNAGHFAAGSGWGLWANNGGVSTAERPLAHPLKEGDTFALRFDNNSVQTGGEVGIGLLNGDGDTLFEFYFIGGESTYLIKDSITDRDTGIPFTSTGLALELTFTESSEYTLDVGGTIITGSLIPHDDMIPTRFRVWNENAGAGSGHDFFVNDLEITQAAAAPVMVSDSIAIVRLGPPPELGPIAAQEVIVGDTLNYTNTATGEGPITFAVETDVPEVRWTLDTESGAFSFTPTRDEAGVVEFHFTAANDNDSSPPVTMIVTVWAEPEFTPFAEQNAETGTPMFFTVSATGHPHPTLTLASSTASSGFTFAAESGRLDYTPPFADAGLQTFTFTAENTLGIATQAVPVMVTLTPPAAPTLWVAVTNAFDIVAEWSASEGATVYHLDVHTHPEFLNEIPGMGGFEDFESIGDGSTFTTRIWTNGGVIWTGTNARASDTIDDKAIGLQASTGILVSQPISGGIDALSVDFKRASGGPPASFNLFVNDTSFTTPNYNTSVQTLTVTNIGISGEFTIRIENTGSPVGVFDNLTWTNSPVPGGVFLEGYSNLTVEATSAPVAGLDQGETYYLRVRAVNDAGTSPYSDTVSVTTLLEMVRILTAAHSATDGSGAVTLELEAFHPTAETIDLEIFYSADNGVTWTNAWLASATDGVVVDGALQDLPVRDQETQFTNSVELIWSSTNAPALSGATGTLVRARGWDGVAWSVATTSEPFLVDNLPPDASQAWVTIPTSPFGPYTFSPVLTNSWGGFEDPLSGIAGYYIALIDGSGTDQGDWTTAESFALPVETLDEEYTVYVWAADHRGNIGESVSTSIIVLSEDGDYDGGGMSNRDKEIAGVSVINPAAVFAAATDTEEESPTLSWPWATDRIYTIYWSDGPLGPNTEWTAIELSESEYGIEDGYAIWSDENPLTGTTGARYYRVNVRLAE